MQWTPGEISEDIEDRRDSSGGGGGPSFGGFGGGSLGIGGTIILVVLSVIFKQDFFSMVTGGGTPEASRRVETTSDPARSAGEKREVQFVSFVLDDAQRNWDRLLPQAGASYRHARLVLFRDYTQAACGAAEAATGPFYCPADEKVYVDLSFFDELSQRFGAPGEFAQAYVLAHEIGHHVQKVLGIEGKVRRLQESDPRTVNPLSVKLELQADCFAGVWAKRYDQAKHFLDPGDVENALAAAAAIGDDTLQRQTQGQVVPDSFTHGTSAQRVTWLKRGLQTGDVQACNTFRSQI
ncbi:MAG: neutral zinc metallopeptidase [Betaproteobacteria bacterium]